MAFFKFRKSGDEQSATPVQPESVEAMRKRAKYRLMGAAVLVLVGVIGFPLLFDKQPRPIAVDMPIEIPDKSKVKPLNIPAPAALPAVNPEVAAPVAPAAPAAPASVAPVPAVLPKLEEKVAVAPVAIAQVAPKLIAKVEPKPVEKVAEKAVEKVVEKPAVKPVPTVKPVSKADESAKAQALLEGRVPEKKATASEGRFVVQVGAFADIARAREVRLKLEHAGLKTYTQVADTKDGRRVRVRVGPFADKVEADKAAEKIKKMDLSASVLTL